MRLSRLLSSGLGDTGLSCFSDLTGNFFYVTLSPAFFSPTFRIFIFSIFRFFLLPMTRVGKFNVNHMPRSLILIYSTLFILSRYTFTLLIIFILDSTFHFHLSRLKGPQDKPIRGWNHVHRDGNFNFFDIFYVRNIGTWFLEIIECEYVEKIYSGIDYNSQLIQQ